MRCVVQRVTRASVEVEGEITGEIGLGFLALLGVEEDDTEQDKAYIVKKLIGLRVFEDECGKMNKSVSDVGGAILLVSQFTLSGDVRHGNRPSFSTAARPEVAQPMCARVVEALRAAGLTVETGRFRAHMSVSLVNDGPVTILMDSRKGF